MKKSVKMFAGIAASALVLPSMVNAEVSNGGTGNYTADASINSVDTTTENYDVQISWGQLKYDYKKSTSDTYQWTTVNNSNYVEITNYSSAPVHFETSFSSTIEGVSGEFSGNMNKNTRTCNLITDVEQPRGWGEYVVFTDSNCSTQAVTDSSYTANTYYGVVLNNEAVGAQAPSEVSSGVLNAASSSVWYDTKLYLNLTGGSLSDVQDANNSDKKIGTVTVSIDEAS